MPQKDDRESEIDRLLGQMTLEEKAAQMHGLRMQTVDDLYLTPDLERLGVPGFRMVDGPRGVRAGRATAFPVGMARGATFDPELELRVGRAIGLETAARGGNVLLAPVVNLLRHPRWGRAQETYGEDTHHLGEMGAAFVRGAQEHVVASVKHYAANSIENNRFTVSANLDERTLREVYLPHFRKTVEAGVGSVMSAYNRVNREWCAESRHLVREILKDEWGFDGFVESDWIFGVHSTAPSALAGLDIEMPAANYYGEKLVAAVRAGEVPEAIVDDAVRRILRIKLRFGLFERRPAPDPSVVACPAHTALAREVARAAIVLLSNRDRALPLDRSALRSIAVVGALADQANLGDRGSSFVSPPYAVTPLAGIAAAAGGAIEVAHVATDAPSAGDLARIARADAAVVVVGLTSEDEGEGQITVGDRARLELRDAQRDLVLAVARANPRTIVVLEGGSAIAMEEWVDAPAAVLMAWYPGMEGGHAIADVLFGDASPSGKLPITFARSEDQLPPFASDRDEVDYGWFHGYRLLDRDGAEPRFAFGFGLSYATFALSSLRLDSDAVSADGQLVAHVEVSNIGGVAGAEVVQLYVGCTRSRVERAVRELRAFARVELRPGERRSVTLTVPAADLAFWDDAAKRWVVEETSYAAWVGTSSRDLPLRADFAIRSR
ncbi:MAG TPA: glycoside hydrolase family 3 C-terminal domain-containing protein [Candidatus Binatia bacterium]|nr:glycoside hydrolase family 3 C-terminal domain-containing protein [Candidatus Binatia bacterium]